MQPRRPERNAEVLGDLARERGMRTPVNSFSGP